MKNTPLRTSLLAALLAAAGAPAPAPLSAPPALDSLRSMAPLPARSAEAPELPPAAGEQLRPGVFDAAPERVFYITPSDVDLSLFPEPPAAGSAEDSADLAEVKRWQAARTAEQCRAAQAQEHASYESFFGSISPFGQYTPKAVSRILDKVKADTSYVDYTLKRRYQRPRPFLRDDSISPCLAKTSGYSYPSGHSTAARVFGLLLSDLAPSGAAQFMAYSDQAALNRVIGGVHHPSDIEAGKKLGDAVYAALKRNSAFRKDLAELKKYLKP